MDPMSRGPEEFNHADDTVGVAGAHAEPGAGPQRPSRDREPGTPDFGQRAAGLARTVQLVAGDFLLTVNPVDGSEIENCPPGEIPGRAVRRGPAERAENERAARPPLPPGLMASTPALLERQEERARLVRLLGRGRSVRLTGPAGSGRSALLDAVAGDCAELAPDGVVRLSGHRRTPTELLHELYATVFHTPLHRPDRATLLERVHEIGAVVVLDDLEFGGATLEELLMATPECAYLLAATPDVQAPHSESHVEEVFLSGLGRSASLELLEQAVDRALTDEEANWAGDLWFESEGLPLRFVQAGALLRQRDHLRGEPNSLDPYGFPLDEPAEASVFSGEGREIPLPTLGEGAAPAALLASRLSESARATLRFAVALGGEVPHQAHLPALIGDTHADAALGELLDSGLLSPVGSRYRLAAGVLTQLESAGYATDAAERAHTAAQHYTWWTGHPSVTPERAVAEADAVLASMSALVPGDAATEHPATAVKLARTAAPVFAAGLHWGAWERTLRVGSEAARLTGEVAEEAYFHHELGVLALCNGGLDRARAELEASIGLRGALADKRGTVAGRRALALVEDRSGGLLPGGRTPSGEEVPAARYEESQSPPGGVPAVAVTAQLPDAGPTLITRRDTPVGGAMPKARRALFGGARRNLVAAGAGALLAAVLGTVVTLGATSNHNGDGQGDHVKQQQSANEDDGSGGLDADPNNPGSSGKPGGHKGGGSTPSRSASGRPGASGQPVPGDSGSPSATGHPTTGPTTGPTKSSPSGKPSNPGKPSHPTPPTPPTKPSPSTATPSTPTTPSSPASSGGSGPPPPSTKPPPPSGPASKTPTSSAPAGSKPPTTSNPSRSAPVTSTKPPVAAGPA
ncbi:ATP-binding protein [Streptomyces sp. SDr-06]|uniref:ATP-binding protein n=1 Tax=Streptomyces sp. SDr-06 TaxID=2267702 RepID=UPI000DEA0AE3|nr:ATP-binding protein [Streptomyces sp. SDr-06]RCH66828.1 ATP-binding protein [Streptomyces sp. SDr-06]